MEKRPSRPSNQDLFGIVIDTIPGYVSWISSDLRYLGINQAIADAFQIDREKIVGQKLGSHSGSTKNDFFNRVLTFFASPKERDSFEVKIRVGQAEHWHLVEAKKYNEGKEALFVGIDITARRNAEEALVKEQEQRMRDARLASIGEMAASIVHEIKTPLGVLIGNADLLADRLDDPQKCAVYIGKIQKTSQTITKIIKALQKQSRQGGNDPFEPTNLHELLGDVLLLCENIFRDGNISLIQEAIPNDFQFAGRATQLSQVLVNLLKNSAEAIADLPSPWIRIEFRDFTDTFELSITDAGPGIPPEIRKKLMQPFFTTKGVGKGTGIGLSLSRRVAEEHGGSLRIDEKSPHTRFVLTLPKRQDRVASAQKKIAA